MSEKRRDSKGRLLHNGEIQMPNGRYRYKYYDSFGKQHFLYSWKLENSDPVPNGKRNNVALREQERQTEQALFNHLAINGGNMTVLQLVERYIETRVNVRETTKRGYRTVVNFLRADPMGARRIDTVTIMDAKHWIIALQRKQGKRYSTIHTIRGVLNPAFQMAYEDDLIRKNPFSFQLKTVLYNDSEERQALTQDEMEKFLRFIYEDEHYKRYYDGMYILFHTGLRISEFVGLTLRDVDFKNHRINVNHQLLKATDGSNYIEHTKTEKGIRMVPMTAEVEAAFKRIIKARKAPKIEPIVDGYTGFIFLDKNSNPCVAMHWEHYFQYARAKYNRTHTLQLPTLTPHVCRHTFCSRMSKLGMNVKALQYLMGHSDANVTLNVYAHEFYDDALDECKRVKAI